MKNISSRMGYWSAISLLVFFITWIVCFVGIAISSPLYFWSGLPHYLSYIANYNQLFADIAKAVMFFFGPAYVLLIHSYYNCVSADKKPIVHISLLFALAFAVTSSINYFVQLTAVKFAMHNDLISGLEHFLQANPYSVINSVNMLGWTFFLGLSSLFMNVCFTNDHLNKWLKYFFGLLFLSCMLAGVGYCLQIKWLIFLFVNVGTGGSLLLIAVKSIFYFRIF